MATFIELKRQMKCCLSSDGHIVDDPLLITLCGGYACRSCRDSLSAETVRCSYCKEEHKSEDLRKMKVNGLMKHLIEHVYIKELIEGAKDEVNRMENAEDSLKREVIVKIDLIHNDIKAQVATVEVELHKYIHEMTKELNQLKDRLLKSSTLENIKKASEAAAAQTCDHQMDYKYFQELQNRIKAIEKEIQGFKEHINEINFTAGEITFDRSIIGKITKPTYKIKSGIKKQVFGADLLRRGCYSKLKNMIVSSDTVSGDLKILDCDGNYLDSVKHELIKQPFAVYVDEAHKIYLYEYKQQSVLVFDSNMAFLSKFDCPELTNGATFLEVDENHNDQLIFISSSHGNRIAVYNGNSGHFVKYIYIDSPVYMKFHADKFYVISLPKWFTNPDGTFNKIEKGLNCIFVLDRVNHNVLHKLQHPNLLRPRGLYVNEYDDSNIFTTAFYKDDYGNISKFPYLFVFDRNYNLIQSVEIQAEYNGLNSVLFFERKLLFFYNNSVQIHEID